MAQLKGNAQLKGKAHNPLRGGEQHTSDAHPTHNRVFGHVNGCGEGRSTYACERGPELKKQYRERPVGPIANGQPFSAMAAVQHVDTHVSKK
ncbi:hypothetical protein SARC_13853 [Sphaeroforma arctica JP610]|uniref:Uncharacterized protein n=1 Tax=Sphaeroforma arctica JP610 TaxID=667725 RepID=A0A0L0FBZ4_9EUKA|nr:hypothetical protein SARC_13853 [Sphaeroforma arctica JP610]KNC73588.1 hypothetical protein SARC_13853 [Sphaeroforma arctica JP610]|eukprot:XP_014147490.1 hypothetical protein SARC_13853 [Sphaeroforma arctica JP610]